MRILIQIIKITSLASIFALAFHFSHAYLSDEIKTKPSWMSEVQTFSDSWNNNKYNFRKSNTQILSNVWVAISTNIWIKYKQRKTQNLYSTVPAVAKYVSSKNISDNANLSRHILKISEHNNVLKTDIKWMLKSSYSRSEVLESYIDQLKYRYKWTIIEMQSLLKKKEELTNDYKISSARIDKIKIKIDKDFREFNSSEIDKNIEIFLESKSDYNYAKTHIIFINQYLKQYQSLNNSNKKLLDTLINNKEAIVKNSQIVIPSTGIEVLKKLDLIIDEK